MKLAVDWLRQHQDSASGKWQAPTMTKKYPPGSIQEGFMDDAATAFAAMALLGGDCGESKSAPQRAKRKK